MRGELALVALCTGFVWLSSTWVTDDAYIVFRVVRNVLAGEGLVWNLGYRVQVCTDPLWLGVVSIATLLAGAPEHAAFALSLACAVGCVLGVYELLARTCRWTAVAFVAMFWSSPLLMYQMSSGLETPLLGLLLVLLVRVMWLDGSSSTAGILCGLIVLTRPDALVLIAPLAWHLAKASKGQRGRVLLGVFAPVVSWWLFSTVYFGSPLPNTYWAKTMHGLSRDVLMQHGAWYVYQCSIADIWFASSVVCLGWFAWSGAVGHRRSLVRASWVATLAHLLYVVWIGGDYLLGRFVFSSMMLASVTVGGVVAHETSHGARKNLAIGVMLAAVGVGAVVRTPLRDALVVARYLPFERVVVVPNWAPGVPTEAQREVVGERVVKVVVAAGRRPYLDDADVIFVDTFAIGDPLMARMVRRWHRPGHASREVPGGYLEVLSGQRSSLDDPELDAFFRDVLRLSTGPLFTWERWRTVVRLAIQPGLPGPSPPQQVRLLSPDMPHPNIWLRAAQRAAGE